MSSEDQEDDCIPVAPIALRTVMSEAQGLPLVVVVVAARGQELALEQMRPICHWGSFSGAKGEPLSNPSVGTVWTIGMLSLPAVVCAL